ncbi:MAG: hypothetical protein M3Q10_04820, partial [Chloroflexota bacterium]|nr:hypothetical protein [Chloroflexota bacterium]
TADPAAAPRPLPDLVEARVTRVLDGERIEVVLGGQPTRVRYLGVDAPVGAGCHAAESTRANAALVEGKSVWLEPEGAADPLGTLPRDAWVDDGAGGRILVALRLAEQGAVRPDPRDANPRYAEPIVAASDAARASGAGLWGACEGAAVDPPAPVGRAFAAGSWQVRTEGSIP